MKTVLIIEDDEFKGNSLKEFLQKTCGVIRITTVTNLVDAIKAVNENSYFLIIIDMAIPSHPTIIGEGSPISLLNGGLEVLLELSSMERKDPCIVITQYPDIEISSEFYTLDKAPAAISEKLGCSVLACIGYEDNDSWQINLRKVLDQNGYSDS